MLVQVNIDDEDSKHGCPPACVDALAAAITGEECLCLRGLMALPAPLPDRPRRQAAFMRMRTLFDALAAMHRQADTLSMGMSSDHAEAIAASATMARVGSALFGPRPTP